MSGDNHYPIEISIENGLRAFTVWLFDWVFIFVLATVAIVWTLNWLHVGWDSTDGKERSGMELHTDALTGCQYLASRHGGMTPRLNRDGVHICQR